MFELSIALRPHIKYGKYGLSPVKHCGITFVFADKAGEVEGRDTTVSKRQFSEFVFTK